MLVQSTSLVETSSDVLGVTRYVAEIDIQKVRSLFFVAANTAAGSRYLSRVLTAAAEDPSAEGGRSRAMPNKYLSFYNTHYSLAVGRRAALTCGHARVEHGA